GFRAFQGFQPTSDPGTFPLLTISPDRLRWSHDEFHPNSFEPLLVEVLEALECERCTRLVHPQIEADVHDVIARRVSSMAVPRATRQRVRTQQLEARGVLLGAAQDDAALAHADRRAGLEVEACELRIP